MLNKCIGFDNILIMLINQITNNKIDNNQIDNNKIDNRQNSQQPYLFSYNQQLINSIFLIEMTDFAIDFFNGSLSGIGNCVSGYVFDTLKVRMQLEPNLTMMQQLKKILQNQGFITLFNGMYYPILTVPIVNAILFGSYQAYKKLVGKDTLSFIDGIQNGAFAGFVNSFIVSPVQLVKCQMQNDKQKRFKSSHDCLNQIVRQNGFKGLFRGLMSTIYRQIPAYAAQFACYQQLKYFCLQDQNRDHLTLFESSIVGGLAGINCWLFSYPQDIIKTKLQVENNSYVENKYLRDGGFFQCGKWIVNKQGWKGLWRGVEPCMIRAFVANAFGITIYEKAQQFHKSTNFNQYH